MQKFKGTPGKWFCEESSMSGYFSISAPTHGCLAEVVVEMDGGNSPQDEIELKSNAKLIAAAPELLDALQELLTIGDIHASSIERSHPLYDFESWKMKAESAIKKALGEDDESN